MQPTFDIILRALFVLFIIHIVVFVIDAIRIRTTYKHMNRVYYWTHESLISTWLCIDVTLSAIVCAVLAGVYILTGEII